jgi:hypothetical protein
VSLAAEAAHRNQRETEMTPPLGRHNVEGLSRERKLVGFSPELDGVLGFAVAQAFA